MAGTENMNQCTFYEYLQLKSNAGSKRQHVHGCSLVQARKLYGYHSSEEVFVKIYLYPNSFLLQLFLIYFLSGPGVFYVTP